MPQPVGENVSGALIWPDAFVWLSSVLLLEVALQKLPASAGPLSVTPLLEPLPELLLLPLLLPLPLLLLLPPELELELDVPLSGFPLLFELEHAIPHAIADPEMTVSATEISFFDMSIHLSD